MKESSKKERVSPMTAEIAQMAIEALMKSVSRQYGVEIETIFKGIKDNDES